jgi:hypothetical protein
MSAVKEILLDLAEYEDMAHGPISGTGSEDPYDMWLFEMDGWNTDSMAEYETWLDDTFEDIDFEPWMLVGLS